MANLTRLTRPSQFDELFSNVFWRPVGLLDTPQDISIKTDISEDDKSYTVKAEIPGVKKEDIEVKINGNQLYIGAEIKQDKVEKKDEKVVRSERYYGMTSRSFTFDSDVNANDAEAKYENGVLKLTIPKIAGSKTKQLKIS